MEVSTPSRTVPQVNCVLSVVEHFLRLHFLCHEKEHMEVFSVFRDMSEKIYPTIFIILSQMESNRAKEETAKIQLLQEMQEEKRSFMRDLLSTLQALVNKRLLSKKSRC